MSNKEIRVGEYMTRNIISVRSDQTVEEVERMMVETERDSFPVVGSNQRVIGMISMSDILLKDPNVKVKDLMSKRVISASEDTKIETAARIMFRNGISRLPVSDEHGNIIGIISNTDILRAHIERVTPSKLMKIKDAIESASGVKIDIKMESMGVNELIPTQNKIDLDELKGRKYELKKGWQSPWLY